MIEEEKSFPRGPSFKLRPAQNPALEKKALFTIAKLIFYDGLKQKEITKIKVGDVLQGDLCGLK